MELTAYSVRSFLAPASGSSSYLALGPMAGWCVMERYKNAWRHSYTGCSDVVFWRVPSELTSRHDRLLLGKQRAKEIFRSLPELESFVRIQDQRLHECLGLLTTRFPNGFDG